MRVGVISGSLDPGGAQRVCLKMIEALKEANHQVALITLTKTDWANLQAIMGCVVKPDQEIVLLPKSFRGFDAYKPLLAALLMPAVRRRFKLDLLVNSQGDTLPVASDITYVHYPTFSEYEQVDINLKYTASLFWRLYIAPYKLVHGFFNRYLRSGVLATNSNFSKKAIRRHVDRDAIVITPPVETKTFFTAAKSGVRQNRVISCGRYSPEKNYEYVLQVAEQLRDVQFSVIGSFSGQKSANYYVKLCTLKSERCLSNVELLKNIRFECLLNLYGSSKVYMHAMKGEHFGIVVVEALAAGLVPVVYRGGGPWEDILKEKQGLYGFSYGNAKEAAGLIRKLMDSDALREPISERNVTYAAEFSDAFFKKKFIALVNRIA
jgi:glycosyltransferase involved in cell wall biosynthesis